MIEGYVNTTNLYVDPEDIKVIFDIGSNNGDQAIELAKAYPNAKIYAFECNPYVLPSLYKNTAKYPEINERFRVSWHCIRCGPRGQRMHTNDKDLNLPRE